jgi:DNA polymerase-3 subunit alpha
MPAIAVTDLANMFGLIKFYSGAIKGGIKPVCGCDVVVRGEEGAADTRLLLLAKDREGYLNLSKLISLIYTDNPNRSDASLRLDQLGAFSDGVIALSGGQFSDIGAALLEGDQAKAAAYLSRWRSLFPESF